MDRHRHVCGVIDVIAGAQRVGHQVVVAVPCDQHPTAKRALLPISLTSGALVKVLVSSATIAPSSRFHRRKVAGPPVRRFREPGVRRTCHRRWQPVRRGRNAPQNRTSLFVLSFDFEHTADHSAAVDVISATN